MKNISYVAMALFFMLMVVSNFSSFDFYSFIHDDHQLNDFMSISIALGEEGGGDGNCFNRTKYKCQVLGKEAVSCNLTGNYKQGEECTQVTCTKSDEKLKCAVHP